MKDTNVLKKIKKEFKAYREMFLPEGLSTEKQLEMYKNMVLTRVFEETVKPLWMENKVLGYFHHYIIAEAIAAGVCANLRKDRPDRFHAQGPRACHLQGRRHQ